jgi:peptide/nickel transport system substrate-binding protein
MYNKRIWSLFTGLIIIALIAGACATPTPAPPAPQPAATEEPATVVQPAEPTQPPAEEPRATDPPPPPPPPPAEPKILRMRLIVDVRDMDPAFEIGATEASVSRGILEGLVGYEPGTYNLVNELAEELTVSDDGLTIEFKLREGVQFHHGYGELTAEDVKFSYERYIDPELDAAYKDDWISLDRVEVTGKYTGQIIMKEPYGPLWTTTLPHSAGKIISQAAVDDMGRDRFKLFPIGTGPYEFIEHVPGQSVLLKKFADYWGPEHEWDEIHYSVITEGLAAEIALETNEVDFAEIDLGAIDRFQANPEFEVFVMPALRYFWVGINDQHPKFEDMNVRQAIRYGIDVNQILIAGFEGQAERTGALIAPGMVGYWEDAPLYERDVETARGYLNAAGFDTLDIVFNVANRSLDRTVAEVVQANLAEVGINVIIESHEPALFTDVMMGDTALDSEMFYMSFTGLHEPAWSTMWFLCDQVTVWNWLQWCDEEFDRLHYDALITVDQDLRNDMYIQMQQIWDEAAHTVWLTHGALAWAYRPDKVQPFVFPGTRITLGHAFESR